MKKKIISLVTLCALLGTNVYALAETPSVTASVDYAQGEINVSYSSGPLYNTAVTFVLTRADAANSPENYLRIAEADYVPGKDTECKISFGDDITCRPEQGHCENYKIYAVPGGWKSGDFSATSSDFVICCSEKRIELLDSVNTKPETEAFENSKTILSAFFGIDVSGADSSLGKYFKQIQTDDYNGNFSNIGDLPKVWDTANALLKVNSAVNSDSLESIITENSEILKIDTNDTFYKMDTSEVYKRLYGLISANDVCSLTSFSNKMNDSIAVSAFSNACESKLESLDSIFEKFSKNLGISDDDMATYRNFKNESATFTSNFARQFDKFSDVLPENISKKFSGLLASFSQENISGNNVSLGGGGGGGGAGGGNDGTTVRGETNALGNGTMNIVTNPDVSKEQVKSGFADVPESHWAYSYVYELYKYGVISGYSDGSFKPDALITRGEFIKLITDSMNINDSGEPEATFTDVTPDNWVYPYVKRLASVGCISGYEDGSCGISKNISREEAAVLIARVLKTKNISFIDAEANDFADEDDIADYAKDAVKTLSGADIISGFEDGSFMPKANLTRAQAAVIIFKAASM